MDSLLFVLITFSNPAGVSNLEWREDASNRCVLKSEKKEEKFKDKEKVNQIDHTILQFALEK